MSVKLKCFVMMKIEGCDFDCLEKLPWQTSLHDLIELDRKGSKNYNEKDGGQILVARQQTKADIIYRVLMC